METLRQGIFQLFSSPLVTLSLWRSRLGDVQVGGHCEELVRVVVLGACASAQKTNHSDWLLGQAQVSARPPPILRPSASALHLGQATEARQEKSAFLDPHHGHF